MTIKKEKNRDTIREKKIKLKCPTNDNFPVDPNYAPLSWQDSDIITKSDLKKIENIHHEILFHVQKATTGALKSYFPELTINEKQLKKQIIFYLENKLCDPIEYYKKILKMKKDNINQSIVIESIIVYSLTNGLKTIFEKKYIAPKIIPNEIELNKIPTENGQYIGQQINDSDNRTYKWNGKFWERIDSHSKKVCR